jgi:hypothetical protein
LKMKKIELIALVFFFAVFAATAAAYSCPTGQHFADGVEDGEEVVICVCDNQNKIVQNGACVMPCDANEWYESSVGECHLTDCGIGRSNLQHSCMTICSGSESWDVRTNSCTNAHCSPAWMQYVNANGACTNFECPGGYHWDDMHNTCIDNGCPAGSSRNTYGDCIQQCPQGQHSGQIQIASGGVQTLCVCDDPNKIIQNGNCVMPCDENEYFSSDGVCHARCSAGTHYQNGICIPNSCTGGQIIVNGACRCPDNQHLENYVCVNNPQCPAGQEFNAQGECVCKNENEQLQGGVCIDVCGENEYLSEGECHLTNCGIGRISVYHACINTCNNDESWDARSNNCVDSACPIDKYINENGACTNFGCPAGYHWDNLQQPCIRDACPIGTYRNAAGVCTNQCPEGKHWNDENTECIPDLNVLTCTAGTHDENGTCVPDQITCAGGQHDENGSCVQDEPTIQCAEGETLENGVCVTAQQEPPADTEDSFPVSFPVAELGNCSSQTDCEAYCNVPEHVGACLDFAEANGLMSSDELATARRMLQYIQAGTTPGHCTSKQSCDAYCDKQENLQECINFAVQIGEITQQEADMALKTGGVGPGGCKREQCQTYCNDESHFTECIDFAVANGLISEKEAEMAKKTGGKGPAGCKREECQTYCQEPAHQQECFQFAVQNGIIPQGEVEMMTECMKGPSECSAYCNASDEHFEACVKMWETGDKGPSPEELRRMKLNYYESPGNCKGNQTCVENYCKSGIPERSIECERFQVKLGEKTQEQFDQWQQQFNENMNVGPTIGPKNGPGCPDFQPQVLECTSQNADPIIDYGDDGCLKVLRCEPKKDNCPQGEHWENGGCMPDNPAEPEIPHGGCQDEAPPCNAGPPVCVNDHWECTAMPPSSGGDQGFHCGPDEHLENGACVSSTPQGQPSDGQTITGQVIGVSTNLIDSILKLLGLK